MGKFFNMKDKFCLVGNPLKHSFSQKIHALLGDYDYSLQEVNRDEFVKFVQKGEFKGYNVTIPYKKDIIRLLDEIDERAKNIGAVNTVVVKNGKKVGYNTDFDGFIYMLNRAKISVKDKTILILGSGGTSLTATAVVKRLGAKEIMFLSREGRINYQNYQDFCGKVQVLINTTPVGMYPNNYSCKINLDNFPALEGVVDVVYNPLTTKLIQQAIDKKLKHTNGLPMLVAQAKFAMEKFLNQQKDDDIIEQVINKIQLETQNIVLIGMPGCGKSTIGKILAEKLKRECVDIDERIEQKAKKDIKTIFSESGEDYFRKLESEVILEVGCLTGKIICTGGGAVKLDENYFPLKQNGKIFYLKRDLDKLLTENRPLSKDKQAIERLYQERKGQYEKFADITLDNNFDLQKTVEKLIGEL